MSSETTQARSPSSATAAAASFIAGTSYESLPEALIETGKTHILDGLGVALAGATTDTARLMRQYVARYASSGQGTGVIGASFKVPSRFAAFANGISMHAEDFDDTNQPTGGSTKTGGIHTTTIILPTVLSLAEERNLSGRDLITAFHVGTEIACKMNDAIYPRHYEAGFHSTGTIGTFGATAAAANAYGLTADRVAVALGIAASQASGLRENFGTMIKPFHAGHAAESGIVAADLADLGASASSTILDAERGFFGAFANGFDPHVIEKRLGKPWALLDPGSLMKAYPSGAVSHAAMSLLEDLIAEHDIRADQVERLIVTTQPKLKNILIHPRPRSALEAKFSMSYGLAVILLKRRAGLPEFEDEVVRSAPVQEMLGRIEHQTYQPQPEYSNVTAFLEIRLSDGRTIQGRADFGKGSPQRPMTPADVAEKFRACAAAGGLPRDRAERIVELVAKLEALDDIGPLIREIIPG